MHIPLLLLLWLAPGTPQDGPDVVRVGHWLEVRGGFDSRGVFVAERVELGPPGEYELLIGTVPEDERDPDRFELLGQPVHVSARTEWEGVAPGRVAGKRVKVQGHWQGPGKLSAREIQARGAGRERIGGRVDALRRVEGGVEVRIMRFTALLPDEVEVEHESPLDAIPLAGATELTAFEGVTARELRNEDDLLGEGFQLTDTLRLEGLVEWRSRREWDIDLDDPAEADRLDNSLSSRSRLIWTPHDGLSFVAEAKLRYLWRDDEVDGLSQDFDANLGETFVYARDLLGVWGLDVVAGRQDFDEPREWIYDQDLDALRLFWSRPELRLELSASTTLADGDGRDRDSTNWVAYLSNNDYRRHLAVWSMLREVDHDNGEERNLHVGGRMIGRWLPGNESWLELAYLGGERDDVTRSGWGYDAGTTWSPAFAGPFSFTIGYAFGSGDSDPDAGTDGTFRQTGYQDNNAKFAGVTSFRYYGELLDPELANLSVFTAGIGARVAERTSLDLVYHAYTQDEALARLYDADIDADPDGVHTDLGWGLDLVLGWRRFASWDLELVGAYFEPGAAFPGGDPAYLGQIQIRYRY